MAIEGIVRKCLAGQRPAPGARPATHALELADYDALFAGKSIYTGFRHGDDASAPVFRRVLGSAFDALPQPLRELHGRSAARCWTGSAQVRRGRGAIARLVGALIGFPREGDDVPLRVTLTPEDDGERWTRDFAGKVFASVLRAGAGRNEHLLIERFGMIEIALALVVEDGRLYLIPRRWSFLGFRLPVALLPVGTSFECERDGRFAFDVEIGAPVVGSIVAYRGTLEPG
jgi:hypothetical protein